MKPNVGTADRILRAIFGAALILWALTGGPLWAWIGLVPLATAVFRFCPAYSILGISTCAAGPKTGPAGPSGPTSPA